MNVLAGLLAGVVFHFVGEVADVCTLQVVGVLGHGAISLLVGVVVVDIDIKPIASVFHFRHLKLIEVIDRPVCFGGGIRSVRSRRGVGGG